MFTNASKTVIIRRVDPLVFDLDGDGIETVAVDQSTTFFDMDRDGFRERTEWLGSDDGFLAVDVNGNGRIDDISELFGDDVYANGFQKLATYDSNGDNIIDARDQNFDRLMIWRDVDQDGITDPGEMRSLAEASITSINLSHDSRLQSTYLLADESTGRSADLNFAVSQIQTVYNGEITLDPEVLLLPMLRGYGEVKDLPVAMSDTPALKELVSELSGMAANDIYSRIDELLAVWTGADMIDPTAMRGGFSARKLAVLEKFTGEKFTMNNQGQITSNAFGNAVTLLGSAYATLKDHVFTNIALQTAYKNAFPGLSYDFFTDGITATASAESLAGLFADALNQADPVDQVLIGRIIKSADDQTGMTIGMLEGRVTPQVYETLDRLDAAIIGTSGTDVISGSNGADIIFGGGGNDILRGGDGLDTLAGGAGNDTYLFNRGDGADTIYDGKYSRGHGYNTYVNDSYSGGKADRIVFGEGITAADIALFQNGKDLVIGYGDQDRVVVQDAANYGNAIERIELDNGAFLTNADINRIIQEMAAIAVTEGVSLNSVTDVRQNEHMMQVLVSSWNT